MSLQVYSVRCAWTGPIEKAGRQYDTGIPCCPHCRSAVYEGDKETFWRSAHHYERHGYPGYVALLKWIEQQPRCWQTLAKANSAFEQAHAVPQS